MKTTAALLLATMSSLAAPGSNAQEADNPWDDEDDELNVLTVHVSAHRLPSAQGAQSVVRIDPPHSMSQRMDTVLSAVPGVGLFRRADSETAHPTTQGLTMRGVGANAAGRVLVTLDGVPLNDPFGGWVYWNAVSGTSLETILVRRGGSPGAFGASALAGSVELETQPSSYAHVSYGGRDTFSVDAAHAVEVGDNRFSLNAAHMETGGAYLIAREDRGPVDVPAASDSQRASLTFDHRFSRYTQLFAHVAYFHESRVNGLSLATNATEAIDASLRLVHHPVTGVSWEVIAYYRDRQFDNVFASARDERTTERAVLDQFDVPAWGSGLMARVQFDDVEVGVDGRRMSGETNERFRNLGDGFTRQRLAGGDQWTLGLYGEYAHKADWGDLSATLRYDRWRTYNGVRAEASIEDGPADFATPLREDDIADRDGGVWSGRVGAAVPLTGAITMRTAAYKSWRLPTLNEYFRPFRVVNDITEANPSLTPETLYGVEIGFDYQPLNTVKGSITFFRNWLHDGVGNVTIGFGPGFFDLGGFVPAGGVLRQRANIDRSVTDGIEIDGHIQLQSGWQLIGRYLFARSRITRFDARPELEGLRPVQTPRHSATLSARYDDDENWSASAEVRYASGQFDDDLNARRLDSILTLDAGAEVRLTEALRLTAQVENLFDAVVVSAVTADGLETLAQRRLWRVGLSASF